MGPGVSVTGRLRVSVCCSQGGRKYMEDRVGVYREHGCDQVPSYVFLAVFDGHGGSNASDLAQRNLRTNIVLRPGFASDNDDEVLQAIREGFLLTQQQILREVDNWPKTSSGFPSTSGTTASVVFIRQNKLYIGHVGDSAIALGKRLADGSVVANKLTVDHKPDDPEEQRRISERGGEVMTKSGVKRVVWVRPVRQASVKRAGPFEKIPFLAVARALGDVWSYNSTVNEFIVSPKPDVSVITLESDDVCLVIGSDGLWNVLSAQNVVEIVNCHEWKELADDLSGDEKSYRLETNHARWIARQALMRWGKLRADNISVIAVLFDPPDGSIPYSRSSVFRDERIFDIEEVLTDQPTAVVHIRAHQLLALRTNPVELLYYGIVEAFANGSRNSFSGPGYTEYSEGSTLTCIECTENDGYGSSDMADVSNNGNDEPWRDNNGEGVKEEVQLESNEQSRLIRAKTEMQSKNGPISPQSTSSFYRDEIFDWSSSIDSISTPLSCDLPCMEDAAVIRHVFTVLVSPNRPSSSSATSSSACCSRSDMDSARLLESLNLETKCSVQQRCLGSSSPLSVGPCDRISSSRVEIFSDLLATKRREGMPNEVNCMTAKRFKCAAAAESRLRRPLLLPR